MDRKSPGLRRFHGNSSNHGLYRRAEPQPPASLRSAALGLPGFRAPTLPLPTRPQLRQRGGMDGKRKTSADGVDRRTPEERLRDVQKIFHIFPRWYVRLSMASGRQRKVTSGTPRTNTSASPAPPPTRHVSPSAPPTPPPTATTRTREGPWSPVAYVYIAIILSGLAYAAPSSLATFPSTPAATWEHARLASGAMALYMAGVLAYMFKTTGWYPIVSYTMQSWTYVTLRHVCRALGLNLFGEFLLFPAIVTATVTVTLWWTLIAPTIWYFIKVWPNDQRSPWP